jgi:hypothetical protein
VQSEKHFAAIPSLSKVFSSHKKGFALWPQSIAVVLCHKQEFFSWLLIRLVCCARSAANFQTLFSRQRASRAPEMCFHAALFLINFAVMKVSSSPSFHAWMQGILLYMTLHDLQEVS